MSKYVFLTLALVLLTLPACGGDDDDDDAVSATDDDDDDSDTSRDRDPDPDVYESITSDASCAVESSCCQDFIACEGAIFDLCDSTFYDEANGGCTNAHQYDFTQCYRAFEDCVG